MTPDTQELPRVLRDIGEVTTMSLPQVQSSTRRRSIWPTVSTTTVSVVCLGMAVGLPMMRSLHNQEVNPFAIPSGITQTHEPPPSGVPLLFPSQEPVEQQQAQTISPTRPTPIHVASACETQAGTAEGQLPDGESVLPATISRPSVFVVSPDRSSNQSFTVRPADNSDADWLTVSEGSDVGIVGIATSDIRFRTSDGGAVWGKSCEPTPSDAVADVESRVRDLCSRGLRAVVVYQVDANGQPVKINSTECS